MLKSQILSVFSSKMTSPKSHLPHPASVPPSTQVPTRPKMAVRKGREVTRDWTVGTNSSNSTLTTDVLLPMRIGDLVFEQNGILVCHDLLLYLLSPGALDVLCLKQWAQVKASWNSDYKPIPNVPDTLQCSCRAWERLYSCKFPTMWKYSRMCFRFPVPLARLWFRIVGSIKIK